MYKHRISAVAMALAVATCPAPAQAHHEAHHWLPERLPVEGPYPLPEVGSVPEPPPDAPPQHSTAAPLTFESLFLKKPALIPSSAELLNMLAGNFGCRFTSLVEDSLECPLDIGPANTYISGTTRGGFTEPARVMVPVKHRLTLERLPSEVRTYSKALEFGKPQVWTGRDGSQNLEVEFKVEGEPYRLSFRYYDFGEEV